jgi:dolichol-phosphate mannosyltransferase
MLSVIVPTYDERDNLRALFERALPVLRALGEPSELIVVDDASPDGTAEAARSLAEEMGASDLVRVEVRTSDRGLAKAVAHGLGVAAGDVVAVMDADLSHPPELLPALLAPIRAGDADVTVGSRRVPGGGVSNWPLRRRFASWSAAWLARFLTPVRDTTSGFFAVRRDLLEGVALEPIGYKIALEVLVRTGAWKVIEVPFVFTDRTAGASKLGGRVVLAYLQQLEGLYRLRFPRLARYVQYVAVGAAGYVVNVGVAMLLYLALRAAWGTDVTQAAAAVAALAGFAVATAFDFAGNRRWTFREAQRARPLAFAGIQLVGLGIRLAVTAALLPGSAMRGPLLIVEDASAVWAPSLAGAFLASLWNFSAARRWVFPTGPGRTGRDGLGRGALALALALGVGHLLCSGWFDLAGDEAYYWQWSRDGHLAAGYHDHPPMVAYLVRAGTWICGENEIGIRFFTVLMFAGLAVITFATGRAWSRISTPGGDPHRAGLWAAGALVAMPLVSVGGLLATPDAPLLFFWSATLLLVLRALETQRTACWVAVGVPLGLGILSKYHMGLLPVGLLIALLASAPGRRALRGPGPYLAVAVAVLPCLPFAAWMLDNDFGGLGFQFAHGMDRGEARTWLDAARSFGEFIGGQVAFVTPVIFFVLLLVLVRALARLRAAGPSDSQRAAGAVLLVPTVLVLSLFTLASLRASPEANWPSVAYPGLCVLAGPLLARWSAARGHARARAWVAVGLAALVSLYVHVELMRPTLLRGGFVSKVEPRGPWGAWAQAARSSRPDGRQAPVLADSYRTASLLAFYLRDRPRTGAPFEYGSGEQYAHWEHEQPLTAGRRAWYFTRSENDARVAVLFDRHELVSRYAGERLGQATRTYYAWWGELRGEPIPRAPLR